MSRWLGLASLLLVLLSGCGEADDTAKLPQRQFAVGITEANPNFFWSEQGKPDVPAGFSPWRERFVKLNPRYYRLTVNWAQVQPQANEPPNWELSQDGCLRQSPCGPWQGVREQLQAIRSQQARAGTQFEVLVVPLYAPEWATERLAGCVRAQADPRSFAVAASAIPAYKRMLKSLLALAEQEQVELRWWSAWNEPNHPGFITPQRDRCDRDGRALAPAVYARLVRALKDVLDAAPGDQRLELGELAGYQHARKYATGAVEFLKELPDNVVCAASVWGQHSYVMRERGSENEGRDYSGDTGKVGDPTLFAALIRELDSRPCAEQKRIWVTETGAGGKPKGELRPIDDVSLERDCRAMQTALRSWYHNPRIDAAFQYSFREDPFFPVGLVDTAMTKLFQPYYVWLKWGGTRAPADLAPALPQEC